MDKLWPSTAEFYPDGQLTLGGRSVRELAHEYGTPLYVFDEETLRGQARAYRRALAALYPGAAQVAYASKAYLSVAIARIFAEEGLDLDVVSGGELQMALAAGFPANRIHFHGNNKSGQELREALIAGVGRVVVDNFHELDLLSRLAQEVGVEHIGAWLRLSPGILAHTHQHIQTGQVDTKFGFNLAGGDAERAVAAAMGAPRIDLVGLHAHIGSQIYETDSLAEAARRLFGFAAEMGGRHGFRLQELSPGGGWGVPMVDSDPEAAVEPYVAAVSSAVAEAARSTGRSLPHLVLEPGRSLVAQAGVGVYTIGGRKEIAGVRTYVAVDGGMADNIRPALYGATYTARLIPGHGQDTLDRPSETVTIAGKFCESGDILIRDIALPRPAPGDLLAVPMAGAYTLAMSSNYNLALRPAVVLVRDGQAAVIQRRETYGDLLRRDLPTSRAAGESITSRAPADATPGRFYKYEALGNDYIMLDPDGWPEPPSPAQVRAICDRRRGVGADGVLWGPTSGEPYGLRMFNPDGSEFEKSGNGLRIFARYLRDRGIAAGPRFDIAAAGGTVRAEILDDEGSQIAMEMGRLSFASADIPMAGPAREVVAEPLAIEGAELVVTAVSIGNPHCVVFVDAPTAALAQTLGPRLEHHPAFPSRTNVQFARAIDRHTLQIEIWERGAGYTLASGTSSCAAAAAAIRTGRCASPITVRMPGGDMLVEIREDRTARLTGNVTPICRGELMTKDGQ